MNLSLQLEDLDGDDRLDNARGDDTHVIARTEPGKVSNRREVSVIPEGRLRPLFLLGGESMFWGILYDNFELLGLILSYGD